MVGCLSAGPTPGSYVLADAKTGAKTTVVGAAEMIQHSANHAVRITGMVATESGGAGFKAIRVDHIASTCRAPFPY